MCTACYTANCNLTYSVIMGRKRKYETKEKYVEAKRIQDRERHRRKIDVGDQKQRWVSLRELSGCDRDSDFLSILLTRWVSAEEGQDSFTVSLHSPNCRLACVGGLSQSPTQNLCHRLIIIQEMCVLHLYQATSKMDANRNIWFVLG